MKSMITALLLSSIAITSAFGQNCSPAGSQACQNMQNAAKTSQMLENERQANQMKQNQQRAGNFVPGPTDKQVGKNTYVSPTYNNGAAGATITRTTK